MPFGILANRLDQERFKLVKHCAGAPFCRNAAGVFKIMEQPSIVHLLKRFVDKIEVLSSRFMFLYPPICDFASVILKEKGWYEQFKGGKRRLKSNFGNRAIMRYTRMVLHRGRLLRRLGVVKNLFCKKKRVLGPFSTPEAAFEAVGGCGLGVDLEELRKFMTKLRMDADNVKRPRVIPVVLDCLKGVRATNSVELSQSDKGPVLSRAREFPHSQPRVQGRPTALTAVDGCACCRIGCAI